MSEEVSKVPPTLNAEAIPLATTADEEITFSSFEQHSGPLPHPSTLEGYEVICPGAADRIISMAEEALRHRNEMEKLQLTKVYDTHATIAEKEARMTQRGQYCALTAIGLLAGLTVWLAYLQQPYLAGISMAPVIGYVVYAYLSKNPKPPSPQQEAPKT